MKGLILQKFGFAPTKEQEKAVLGMAEFVMQHTDEEIFVLRGYAGTGKTSLVGALVAALDALQQSCVLLAPTGRAAKVFSGYAAHKAFTIHRRIYRQKSFDGDTACFGQGINTAKNTLFIVDEASMVTGDALGDGGSSALSFGTGRLLDDLVHFVYNGRGCRLLLVGDAAQLPPVGTCESPALDRSVLEGYGLVVREASLTQVVRQMSDSGILYNATLLRRCLLDDDVYALPVMQLQGFADIVAVPAGELLEMLDDSYRCCGEDGTIIVTRSNVRALLYNEGIRARVLYYDEELCSGEQLMVVKNNYFWLDEGEEDEALTAGAAPTEAPFIANGDTCILRRYRNERSEHGFRFVDAILVFPDYDNTEVEATLLLDTLHAQSPALTREQQRELFQHVWDDYPEYTNKRDRMKAVRRDPFFNALQVKYAYAVTCHKAQGGQWPHVYIDQGMITEDMLGPDYYRWLYTAITRATQKVFLINYQAPMT